MEHQKENLIRMTLDCMLYLLGLISRSFLVDNAVDGVSPTDAPDPSRLLKILQEEVEEGRLFGHMRQEVLDLIKDSRFHRNNNRHFEELMYAEWLEFSTSWIGLAKVLDAPKSTLLLTQLQGALSDTMTASNDEEMDKYSSVLLCLLKNVKFDENPKRWRTIHPPSPQTQPSKKARFLSDSDEFS